VPKIVSFFWVVFREIFGRFLGGCCAGFAWAIWQHWFKSFRVWC